MPDTPSTSPATPTKPADAVRMAVPAGGALVGAGAGGDFVPPDGNGAFRPSGGIALDVGTDVTDRLGKAIPSFGNVLNSVGSGVAVSQTALDNAVIDTVNKLNGTNIKVLTDVIEVLGDDGLPDAAHTQLITQDVSVLNYFMPTFHEWKNVSIAMDLEVGAFHQTEGLTFSATQHQDSVETTGLFWGFIGWSSTDDVTTEEDSSTTRDHEVRWQRGQVRVDAMLGPRRTSKFPVPDKISVGPQIFVTQGAVTTQDSGGAKTRSIDIVIEIRKADGSVNPGKNIILDAAGLLPSFASGSASGPDGKIKATLTRSLTPGFTGFQKYNVSAALGQIRKSFTVTL